MKTKMMTAHYIRALACVLCAAASTVAQEQPKAEAFLFDGYETSVSVDLKKLRDRGVWDELQTSALKMILGMVEEETNFELEAVDRFTMVQKVPQGSKDARRDAIEVFVTEGNQPLAPPSRVSGRPWKDREVGGREVRYRPRYETGRIFFAPHPNVHVEGSLTALQPVLEQPGRVGRPAADLMSMLSRREDRLGYAVGSLTHPEVRQEFAEMLGQPAWPEGDEPIYAGMQLLVRGDEDEEHLVVEISFRHVRAGAGLAVSQETAGTLLAELGKDRRLMSLRKVFKTAAVEVDGPDLVVRMDLGRVRNAVGQLAAMLAPMMMRGSSGPSAPR